jgi:hypothetical protein
VDRLAPELTLITPDALMSNSEGEDIADQAPTFTLFYEQLRSLIGDNAPQETKLGLPTEQLPLAATEPPGIANIPPSSPSTSKKRHNSLTITTSGSTKVRPQSTSEQNVPHTPDQPTIPPNPGHSGDSIESTDEVNTRDMIQAFLRTTLYNLGREFRQLSWPSYAQQCRLNISGLVQIYLLF